VFHPGPYHHWIPLPPLPIDPPKRTTVRTRTIDARRGVYRIWWSHPRGLLAMLFGSPPRVETCLARAQGDGAWFELIDDKGNPLGHAIHPAHCGWFELSNRHVEGDLAVD
jgi:hypothetical protein